MNYAETTKQLIEKLGGEKNILAVTHCMTRMRLTLKDDQSVDDQALKQIEGVMGIMRKSGQYQVIMGNNVSKFYKEMLAQTHLMNETKQVAKDNKAEQTTTNTKTNTNTKTTTRFAEKKNLLNRAMDFISGCITPMIPAMIAGGLIKVILIVLGPALLNWIDPASDSFRIFSAIGDSVFYFLPILVAFTASKKLGSSQYLTVMVASVLLYPDTITLLSGEAPTQLFGAIPVLHGNYASSIIPSMLLAILVKYLELGIDRITPEWTKNFLKPLLVVSIAAPITLVALAPLGMVIGNGLQTAMDAIYNFQPWLAMLLLSAGMPFIIMTGMHWAFVPAAVAALGNPGYELMVFAAMLASNVALGGSALAVALKSKDSKMRQIAVPAAISALLAGVTEPAMYGVALKMKKPLYAACLASGIGGFIAGLVQLKAFAFAVPSFISLVQFVDPNGGNNFLYAGLVAGLSFAIAFILTLILSKKELAMSDIQ